MPKKNKRSKPSQAHRLTINMDPNSTVQFYCYITEEQEEVDRRKEEERKQKLAEKKRRHEAALAEMAAQYEEWVS